MTLAALALGRDRPYLQLGGFPRVASSGRRYHERLLPRKALGKTPQPRDGRCRQRFKPHRKPSNYPILAAKQTRSTASFKADPNFPVSPHSGSIPILLQPTPEPYTPPPPKPFPYSSRGGNLYPFWGTRIPIQSQYTPKGLSAAQFPRAPYYYPTKESRKPYSNVL